MTKKKRRAKSKKEKTDKHIPSPTAKHVWDMLELSDKIEEKINQENGDSS